jgi:excisionase family DNA binding protein
VAVVSIEKRLLSTAEVAAMLGVGKGKVWNLVAEGYLQPVRLGRNARLKFRPEDVERLIAPQEQAS